MNVTAILIHYHDVNKSPAWHKKDTQLRFKSKVINKNRTDITRVHTPT